MAAAIKASPGNSPSSSMSSPEGNTVPDAATAQKRKGGRKPVYATQEERKMRNRAAQAAFRERRTEYIKHLEATIKQQEETLATLQQSSRSAADEVLMLRYKNSLLERILLEKRIDVHAELKAFTDNDAVPAGSAPSLPPHPPHVQRALHQRMLGRPQQHQFHNQHMGQLGSGYKKIRRLSESSFFPKQTTMVQSPTRKVTSPSVSVDMASPVTSEPSPAVGSSNHSFITRSSIPPPSQRRFSHATDLASLATLYPQQYQAHMDKLDQEYDAEMYDENEGEEEEEHATNGHDISTTLQTPEFVLAHRGQQGSHPSHSQPPGPPPALSSPESGATPSQSTSGPVKIHNTTTNENMLQQYYSTGSWTVDLFTDPYMMGPLQFPNPFTTFPTSSMR